MVDMGLVDQRYDEEFDKSPCVDLQSNHPADLQLDDANRPQ